MDLPFEMNDEEFLEVRIDNVSISNLGFIVFLRHAEENRVLPIFIGANEAHSIALALNGQPAPRPMTHDLFKTVLDNLGWEVARIQVTHIEESTFFGRIHLSHQHLADLDFDARPSDALALALRYQAPIQVHKQVFEQASVPMTHRDESEMETGMRSMTTPTPAEQTDPIAELQKKLAKAVEEERYEEAAKLRDAIRKLQTGN